MNDPEMYRQGFNSQDIVRLLSRLKDSTPDYPFDLMVEKKATFLKQSITMMIDQSDLRGKGGGDRGDSRSGQ